MPTDYYSLLHISPRASKLDIINAYRHAKLTFRKDSLAVYTLYSEEELAEIREQVDKAYAILSDREKRRVYDDEHGYAPVVAGCHESEDTERGDIADAPDEALTDSPGDSGDEAPVLKGKSRWGDNVVSLHRRKPRDFDPDLERRIQDSEVFSGSLLREVREYRGIELQDVAERTRISMCYLKAIENEDIGSLPARAYLKGYIGQYAAEIDLEPHRVVLGYPPLSQSNSQCDPV